MISKDRKLTRSKRKRRIRKNIFGAPERPRLCIFRSSRHIYAQIIDDLEGRTLVFASTLDRELRDVLKVDGKVAKANEVGKLVAKRALARGIKKVVFDRGGFLYHGRVKAVANGAREIGLKF